MKLIIASNRLPFTTHQEHGEIEFGASSGGVASGLEAYLNTLKKFEKEQKEKSYVWIGWPGGEISKNKQLEISKKAYDDKNAIPVFLDEKLRENFYEGFCNKIIWPLFHYFPSYSVYDEEYWDAYVEANKKYRDEILKVVKDDDLIWIHDYQLMLLPALLREKLPNAKIGFFLHIPFPSFEIFRLLPGEWKEQILKGLLGADVIGFHTQEYTQYFLRVVLRILGIEPSMGSMQINGRKVLARTFPLGIDFERFYKAAVTKEVKKEKMDLKKSLNGYKTILSIDRLDYTKGIGNRLEGYQEFLEKNPKWHKKIVLLMVVIPSRTNVEQYQKMKKEIEELIGRINGQYGSVGWTPILYQFNSVAFNKLVALYSKADVALITPFRDGMNLIAKEYLASKNKSTGVLILSEMAGASKELNEAIIINPNSRREIAESILKALEMPEKMQLKKIKVMQKSLREFNLLNWTQDFINSLLKIKLEKSPNVALLLNKEEEKQMIRIYKNSTRRLIFLDYDGTLMSYKDDPREAKPSGQILKLLNKISSNNRNEVVMISGRDRETLQRWFGNLPINLVAEHGLLIKPKWASWRISGGSSIDWKDEAKHILGFYVEQLPGSFIEEKEYSIAWHYRKSDPKMASEKSKELLDDLVQFAANKELQVLNGKCVIEIKNINTTKGTAGSRWLSNENFDFIMAIGDDVTDEDLYKVLPESAYSINIESANTNAKYYLPKREQVLKLLKKLAD